MIAASPTKHYSGDQKATQEKGEQGLHGKEIWTKKYGQPDIRTPRGRWRQQHKTRVGFRQLLCGLCSTERNTAWVRLVNTVFWVLQRLTTSYCTWHNLQLPQTSLFPMMHASFTSEMYNVYDLIITIIIIIIKQISYVVLQRGLL